jgi:hypothetical protein
MFLSTVAPAEPHEFDAALHLSVAGRQEALPFQMTEPVGRDHWLKGSLISTSAIGTKQTDSIAALMSATDPKGTYNCLPNVFATVVIEELAGLRWPQCLDQTS